MYFHNEFYPEVLQHSLKNFVTDGYMCDVTLIADGEEFQAHKLILSAVSPYFRTMFNSRYSFIESKQNKVKLHGVDRQALFDILGFIYSSDIYICNDNVYLLMEAINLLQIHALRAFINLYLRKMIGVKNCIRVYLMATLYQYHELANCAFHFLLTNFSHVVDSEEFLQLPFEAILKIVSSRLLDIPSEEELYEHVMKWVRADEDERKKHLEELIKELYLNSLSEDCLTKIYKDPIIPSCIKVKVEEITNKLSQVSTGILCIFRKDKQNLSQKFRYKAERAVLFAIGGESSGMASQSVECFSLGYNKWRYVVPEFIVRKEESKRTNVLPPLRCARFYAAFANDDYNVYVLGGRNSSSLLDECEVFNVGTNQWKYFQKLPVKLFASGAAFLDGELFVVGGYSEDGPLSTVWKLDRVRNRWTQMPPLNCPRFFHATVSVGGYLFVLGGYDSDSGFALRSCEKFDPSCNKWFLVSSMQEYRAKFGCAVVDDFIYVFGGTSQESECLRSVERYYIIANEWVHKPSMLTPRHSFSVAVAWNDIYCLGGSDCTHFLDTVEKFSLRTGRWHCVHSLQISRLAPAAAALLVPYTSPE